MSRNYPLVSYELKLKLEEKFKLKVKIVLALDLHVLGYNTTALKLKNELLYVTHSIDAN